MSVNLGLSVADVVSVQVSLSATAAAQRNFGSLLILGDSGVIDTTSRLRLYSSLSGVGNDFGSMSPEYQAASFFFGATPQPQQLYVGAWARTATSGRLVGGYLSATQQAITNFSGISNGALTLTVDGSIHALVGLNFIAVSNLNAVASIVTGGLAGTATVTWDPNNLQFNVQSVTTGTTSSVSVASPGGSGTDISSLLGLTSAAGAFSVAGIAAESALNAATILAAQSTAWYGLMLASSVAPQDSDYTAVAGFIQGTSVSHIFGVTTQESNALNSNSSADVASQLQALGYSRTFVQYSSSSPYACAAAFGNAFTVNFNGANTLYTLKFTQEAGVIPETLTETQAATLCGVNGVGGKNCNVYVNYNNATAILQNGTMANGTFFDVIHGTDWLQNNIQTAVFNQLLTAKTKVPQTDAGVTSIVNTVTGCLAQSVTNGLVAPGVWNGPAVGAIVNGQTLSTGYYIYAPPIASQSQAARSARQAPVLTACIKLAGAFHFASVVCNVNN